MKQFPLAILFIIFCAVQATAQKIIIPNNYVLIDSVRGDLTKDSIPELVVIYNTSKADPLENEVSRLLVIYQLKDNQWQKWKQYPKVILGSQEGGMMGDPYGGVTIEKNILSISHSGGSSWKWSFTDKYRFQNDDFFLIGYSSTGGKPCEEWDEFDFNISTGKIVYKYEKDDCENDVVNETKNETFYYKGLKITMANRYAKEIKITSPKLKKSFYISTTN